jgi:hypothetical protein
MSPSPAVTCSACGFAWNSPTMVEGLRMLGACSKCGGALAFRDEAPRNRVTVDLPAARRRKAAAPHLVLGLPRR